MNVLNVKSDLEICYCSKDCYFDDWLGCVTVDPNTNRDKIKLIFEKGKGYEFFYEDDNTIWIYYDKFGQPCYQGCRFWLNTSYGRLVSFDEYFNKIMLRKLKLEKLNRITDQLQ